MPEEIQQLAALCGSTVAVGTGIICDPVNVHYFTLNDLSVAAGIVAGVLTAVLQAIKIRRALKNKDPD